MKSRSTVTNLAAFCQMIVEMLDHGGQMDATSTDLQKAFDYINRSVLLAKLDGIGLSGESSMFCFLPDTQKSVCSVI